MSTDRPDQTQPGLLAVLEVFAKAADNYADRVDHHYIDDDAMLTVGDLRNARALLSIHCLGPVICPDCRGERRGSDGQLCTRCGGCAQIARSKLRPGEVPPFERIAPRPQPQPMWREAVQAVLDCYYIGGRDPEKKPRNLGSYIEDLARAVGDKRAPAETADG